jgi:hypothetical protein
LIRHGNAQKDGKVQESMDANLLERHKHMLRLWVGTTGLTFKDYVEYRFEVLKLLLAGNTTGLLAVSTYLITGKTTTGVIAAKVLLVIFAARELRYLAVVQVRNAGEGVQPQF